MKNQDPLVGAVFYIEKALIYRCWVPPGQDGDMAVEQLVQCGATILRLAHSGHLKKNKTVSQILQQFY